MHSDKHSRTISHILYACHNVRYMSTIYTVNREMKMLRKRKWQIIIMLITLLITGVINWWWKQSPSWCVKVIQYRVVVMIWTGNIISMHMVLTTYFFKKILKFWSIRFSIFFKICFCVMLLDHRNGIWKLLLPKVCYQYINSLHQSF